MDAVRAAFDEQMRRHPVPGADAERIEHDGRVTRVVPDGEGWAGVTWSDLDESGADAAIAETIGRFAPLKRPWEWKHYSYDLPADLPDRLRAAGCTPGPDETVLVAEIAGLALEAMPPDGLELHEITDAEGISMLATVHDEAFGGSRPGLAHRMLAGITADPPTMAAVLAVANGRPVSGGRVEFHHGTQFASIWGGGTVPDWRGRGVFRAVVARRAALAAAQGLRYLQVDAAPMSRPILRRIGFAELATTTPFVHSGS